jgi:MATE family multidrug resistance protein
LGIVGAGISTVVATVLAFVLFVAFYFAKEHRDKFNVLRSFSLDVKILRRYWRLGFPSGLELFLNVAAFNLFLLMFQSYGVAEGAAAAIVFNWDILSFVPMIGLNVGVISLIGRFVGARDMARVNEVMTAAFAVALAYAAMLAIIYSTFRYPLSPLPWPMPQCSRSSTARFDIRSSRFLRRRAVTLLPSGNCPRS